MVVAPSWLNAVSFLFYLRLRYFDMHVGGRFDPAWRTGVLGDFGVGVGLEGGEGELHVLLLHPLLQSLYGSFHLLRGLDVRQGLQVDKRPYLILDQFGLYFLEHGMQHLVVEDQLVVS